MNSQNCYGSTFSGLGYLITIFSPWVVPTVINGLTPSGLVSMFRKAILHYSDFNILYLLLFFKESILFTMTMEVQCDLVNRKSNIVFQNFIMFYNLLDTFYSISSPLNIRLQVLVSSSGKVDNNHIVFGVFDHIECI